MYRCQVPIRSSRYLGRPTEVASSQSSSLIAAVFSNYEVRSTSTKYCSSSRPTDRPTASRSIAQLNTMPTYRSALIRDCLLVRLVWEPAYATTKRPRSWWPSRRNKYAFVTCSRDKWLVSLFEQCQKYWGLLTLMWRCRVINVVYCISSRSSEIPF